jgi:hypothetical protein
MWGTKSSGFLGIKFGVYKLSPVVHSSFFSYRKFVCRVAARRRRRRRRRRRPPPTIHTY